MTLSIAIGWLLRTAEPNAELTPISTGPDPR